MRHYELSNAWLEKALKWTPGGSQTGSKAPGRAGVLGDYPMFLQSGSGAQVRDLDGNDYIDLIASLACVGLGHARPEVTAAVTDVVRFGASLSLPTQLEAEVAEQFCARLDASYAEQVRWVRTGSEATEAAIRVARCATGRDKILTVRAGYHCYADGTEVLTIDGFRDFRDVRAGDLVATRRSDGRIEYQPVMETIATSFDGQMALYESRGLSLLVTPNHRMIGAEESGSWTIKTAREAVTLDVPVAGGNACWDGVTPARMRIPALPGWSPGPRKLGVPEILEIQASAGSPTYLARQFGVSRAAIRKAKTRGVVRSTSRGIVDFDAHDFAEFLGYFLAEGFTLHAKRATRYEVHLAQTPGPVLDAMAGVVKRLGFKPRLHSTGLSFASKELWTWLQQCGRGASSKAMPREVKTWSVSALSVLLFAMIDGDGTRSGGRLAYYTTSPTLADDVCEIAMKIGYRATLRCHKQQDGPIRGKAVKSRLLIFHVRLNTQRTIKAQRQWVPYTGLVRCVRVENGTLYVRRNGFPAWCGNSWHSWFQAVKPEHPGVPQAMAELIDGFAYGEVPQARLDDERYAAVILEPIPVTGFPDEEWDELMARAYLRRLVAAAHARGTLVIFDEVVWGLRAAFGGAGALLGVQPDLATFGKALGNGIPIGALVGPRDLMRHASLISGTFGGDRMGLAAAKAVMSIYENEEVISHMWTRGEQLRSAITKLPAGGEFAIRCSGLPVHPVLSLDVIDNSTVDPRLAMSLFLQGLADRGVLYHPAGGNIMHALTENMVNMVVEAVVGSLRILNQAADHGDVRQQLRGEPYQQAFARAR